MEIYTVQSVKHESFTYEIPGHGKIIWDVTTARERADAGGIAATVMIDKEQMELIARNNDWQASKLAHVDIAIPGIGAPMVWQGQIIYVLIDGTHRCVRALHEGKPFEARLLSDDAARQSVLFAPAGLMPWTACTGVSKVAG